MEKHPLTDKQAAQYWEQLVATGESLNVGDLLKIMKRFDCLAEPAAQEILKRSPTQDELLALIGNLSARDQDRELKVTAANRILDMNPSAEVIESILYTLGKRRYEAWRRLLSLKVPDREELVCLLQWYGPPIREEAARLLLEPAGRLSAREISEMLLCVPELHDLVWGLFGEKLKNSELVHIFEYDRIHRGVIEDWIEERPEDPNCPRWRQEVESHERLTDRVMEALIRRFPTERVLTKLVEEGSPARALQAGRLILGGSPTNLQLRKIVHHLPELRPTAWASLRGRPPTRSDLREIAKFVPELKAEAEALIPVVPYVRPRGGRRKGQTWEVISAERAGRSAVEPPPEPAKPPGKHPALRKLLGE